MAKIPKSYARPIPDLPTCQLHEFILFMPGLEIRHFEKIKLKDMQNSRKNSKLKRKNFKTQGKNPRLRQILLQQG